MDPSGISFLFSCFCWVIESWMKTMERKWKLFSSLDGTHFGEFTSKPDTTLLNPRLDARSACAIAICKVQLGKQDYGVKQNAILV